MAASSASSAGAERLLLLGERRDARDGSARRGDASARTVGPSSSRDPPSAERRAARPSLVALIVAGCCCAALAVASLPATSLPFPPAVPASFAALGQTAAEARERALELVRGGAVLTSEDERRAARASVRLVDALTDDRSDPIDAESSGSARRRATPALGAAEGGDEPTERRFEPTEKEEEEEDSGTRLDLLSDIASLGVGEDGLPMIARRGVTNAPVVRGARHDLTRVAAKLGGWGECPKAFARPKLVGNNPRWSDSYVSALALADAVYVLCMRCDAVRVPERLAKKTVLVNGGVFDLCDHADEFGLDHYKRASLLHAAAVSDALNKDLDKIAVVEEDSESPPEPEHRASLDDEDVAAFAAALRGDDWSFLRMGWRQYTLELDPAMACPEQCACEKRADKLCFVGRGGCDLRSSDSYVISSRYYRWMLDALIMGGTVDYDVLPRAPGMLLALPVLSVQERLDIPTEHQAALSDLFVKKCMTGGGGGADAPGDRGGAEVTRAAKTALEPPSRGLDERR
jgi:hypothetical protein